MPELTLSCPECDYGMAVEVKELWTYAIMENSVVPSANPTGYCVLCPRCDCRYVVTPKGAKRLHDAKPKTQATPPQRRTNDVLSDLARPLDEE